MAGFGLMNRRRAIQASPTIEEINTNSYIQDSLVMMLDGIEKGASYNWQDLRGSIAFINYGAEELDNGFRFNGSTSYLMSYKPLASWSYDKNRTMELVFKCDKELTQTAILFAGSNVDGVSAFGYGIFPGNKIMAIIMDGGAGVTTFQYSSVLGGNHFATTNSRATLNGKLLNTSPNNVIAGSSSSIYIGRRSTGNYFEGVIHAIRIYNRALSLEEIEYNRQIDIKRFHL